MGIAFDIPRDLYGHIVSPCQASRHVPLVAPGLILPTGLQSIHLLIANPYAYPLQIRKNQTIGFIHFVPLSNIQDILPFANFSEMDLPASSPGVFPIICHEDVANLLEDQFIEASKLFEKYSHIFAKDNFDLGFATNVQHVLNIGNHPPIFLRLYRRF